MIVDKPYRNGYPLDVLPRVSITPIRRRRLWGFDLGWNFLPLIMRVPPYRTQWLIKDSQPERNELDKGLDEMDATNE